MGVGDRVYVFDPSAASTPFHFSELLAPVFMLLTASPSSLEGMIPLGVGFRVLSKTSLRIILVIYFIFHFPCTTGTSKKQNKKNQ